MTSLLPIRLLTVAALLLAGCGKMKPAPAAAETKPPAKPETPSGMIPVSWAKSLELDSLAGIDGRLKRPWLQPFDVMVKGDLFTITNCADYWKVTSGEWSSTEPREEDYILLNGLDCEALQLLRNPKPTRAADPFELTVESENV